MGPCGEDIPQANLQLLRVDDLSRGVFFLQSSDAPGPVSFGHRRGVAIVPKLDHDHPSHAAEKRELMHRKPV